MDTSEKIAIAVSEIAEKRNELNNMTYNDASYDDVEDDLHDLEDDFNEEFGDFLEEVLADAHADVNSDADVLLPSAYFAQSYIQKNGEYVFSGDDGVVIDSEDYDGKAVRLIFLPDPVRIVLVLDGKIQQELWTL
ncbi:MAG: hypothetical protein GY827_00290 [Cytophagales bacterium]|nr:hypothetical protein [Cytophagales bacterium]